MLPVKLILLLDTRTMHTPTPQQQLRLFIINTSPIIPIICHVISCRVASHTLTIYIYIFCILTFFIDTI